MDKYSITLETYNTCAKSFQDKFMPMDLYHSSYDKFCDQLSNRSAHIFEIACGPGNITRYLLSKRPMDKIFGIDLSPQMIELAKVNNPMASFQVMDCRNISTLQEKYDAVVCGFCLPYLSLEESSDLIKNISELLLPNGLIYLSTMEGEYSKSGYETTSFSGTNQVYVHYHQSEYIINSLQNNGFQIIENIRQNYPEQDGTFTTDMIFIGKKIYSTLTD